MRQRVARPAQPFPDGRALLARPVYGRRREPLHAPARQHSALVAETRGTDQAHGRASRHLRRADLASLRGRAQTAERQPSGHTPREVDLRQRTGHTCRIHQELWVAEKDVLVPAEPDASQSSPPTGVGNRPSSIGLRQSDASIRLVERARGQLEYDNKRAIAWMPRPDIALAQVPVRAHLCRGHEDLDERVGGGSRGGRAT